LSATANVTIQSGEPKQALAVPISAIQNDSQGEYVTLLNSDGNTRRVDITSGDLEGDLVTVSGELHVGDQLLLAQVTNQAMPGSGMFSGGKND
jgi:multidrug efflux pump subunit AcrA (membrane-fusion protein)